MLVLSRKAGEAIRIGENITVTFLGMKNGNVRLGIAAPDNTVILRTELVVKDQKPAVR